MQTKNRKKKLVLKRWVRIVVVCVLFFLASIFLYNIVEGLCPKQKKNLYYSYKNYGSTDYKVYLKENNFFEEKFLPKGRQYTTELIDYIDINFNYLYSGSKLTDIEYEYNISGEIIGEYESNTDSKSEIWNKKYVILENQKGKKYDSIFFDVNKNLKLDYSKYNNEANNFKNQFKLAIDAKLLVKFNVKYTATIRDTDKKVRGVETIELSIPLSKTTMNITTKEIKGDSKNLYDEELVPKNMNRVYINSILLIILLIISISNKDRLIINKKTYYTKNYNKIIKNYSDIIVEVSTQPNLENLEILEIKNFDDLVDTEEELKSPILLYEIKKQKESWFIIIHNKYAYRYILDCEDC